MTSIADILSFQEFNMNNIKGNFKINALGDMVAIVPPLLVVQRDSRQGRGSSLTVTAVTHVLPAGAKDHRDLNVRADFPFEKWPSYLPLVQRYFALTFWTNQLANKDDPPAAPTPFSSAENEALSKICTLIHQHRASTWAAEVAARHKSQERATKKRRTTDADIEQAIRAAAVSTAARELTEEEKQMLLEQQADGGEDEDYLI